MSTFGTNTQIIQEDGIGKESWFDGGILKRSGPIVYSETKDFMLFMDRIGFAPLFWVHYVQGSGIKGKCPFDDADITLHMRSGFAELTGVSQFVIVSNVSFISQLFRTLFDFQKEFRESLATSSSPKKDRQVLIDQLLASLDNTGYILKYPLFGDISGAIFGQNIKNMII